MNGRSECSSAVYVASALAVMVSLATPQRGGVGQSTRPTVLSLWGDLDGDGRSDQLSIEHRGGVTRIGIELSAGQHEPPVLTVNGASSVSVADVDRDGDLDVITASSTGSELWVNDGRGSFTLAKRTSTGSLSAPTVFDLGVDRALTALTTSTPSVLGPTGFRLADGVTRIRAAGYRGRFSGSIRLTRLLRGPPTLILSRHA